jgi:hypothetical protein
MVKSFAKLNIELCHWLTRRYPKFFKGTRRPYEGKLRDDIESHILSKKPQTIIEVGGIDRPLIKKSPVYTYIGVDIEDRDTCYEIYDEFYVQSIEQDLDIESDLIISITLLEHVKKNKLSLRVMHSSLKDGGRMLHYMPSKFHFYSIILRIVGPKLQKLIIKYLRPHAAAVTGYPAFFDYCSPSEMRRLCKEIGFEEVETISYYRANDYFAFFFPLFVVITLFETLFEFFEIEYFASGFILKATK